MPTKLQKIPAPHVKRMDEKIVTVIENLMREYLNEGSRMPLKDKIIIIKKIVRLCSGL
jgi:hypothetical protein